MKCRLAIGLDYYDLAGASGVTSDTQGLQVTYSVNSEQVAYLGVDEARQLFRPGSNVTASFSSAVEFPTVAACEAEIGFLYEFLKDQDGTVTAYLGNIADDGSDQIETATAAGTAQTLVTVSQGNADTIYFTDDGTDPTTSSPTITSGTSFLRPGTFRIKALAVKAGETNSPIISRGFITTGQVNEATVSPESSAQPAGNVTVTVTNALAGVTMHYTTNGTTPTTGSPTVASGGTVSVPVPGKLQVLAVKAGLTNSPIKEANFIELPAASGYTTGTYTDGGTTYRWHKLTADASVRIDSGGVMDYLIVGGGGAGGGVAASRNGGGGGAGQFVTGSASFSPNTIPVRIGKGGISSTTSPAVAASDGGLSRFSFTASGGGGGGIGDAQNGRAGASGGGATVNGIGGAGLVAFPGGTGLTTNRAGGGGSSAAAGLTQSASTSDLSPRAGTTSALDNISTVYCNGGGVLATAGTLTPGSGGAGRRGSTGDPGQNGADGIVILRHVEGAVSLTVSGAVTATPSMTPTSTAAASGIVTMQVTTSLGVQNFSVPVLAGETVATWAATARAQLAADSEIARRFVVSGTGTSIVLTSRKHQADTSLNISLTNGTPSPGITAAPTSADTAPGSPDTVTPIMTIYGAIAQVSATYRGKTMTINSSITGRTTP
jgi:hypothetical protein